MRATPSSQVLPFTTCNSITINIIGNVPTTQKNLVYTSWYFNGGSLPSGTSLSSLLKLPTGITQTLRINSPTPLHAGTYDVLLQLNTGSYFRQFGCPYSYRRFVYSIILDQISFNLQYYGEFKLLSTILQTTLTTLCFILYRTSYNIHSVKQTSSSGQ